MKRIEIYIGLSVFALSAKSQVKESRPNVIYIIMDDLGYGDIGCYGSEKIETPNIDRLYKDGISFTQHYTGSPVSAPARCVLMTGMHSGHAQIRANDEMAYRGAIMNYDSMYVHPGLEGQYPLKAHTMTLGRMMQQAGYVTGCFGKWGLGAPGTEGTPNKQGFDSFYGYNCQRQAHSYYPAFLYKNEDRVYLANKVLDPHTTKLDAGADPRDEAAYAKFSQKEYANDLIFDELISFVGQNRKKPFFLMWTTPLPHVSLQAPEKWVKYYVGKFGEAPYIGKAGYMPCRYPHATYAAMISYFDEQIGKLIEKLKKERLYDNTVIMFTSDNGPTFNGGSDSPWFDSGGPFRSEYGWGKCFVHEGGIRKTTRTETSMSRRRNTYPCYCHLARENQTVYPERSYLRISGCDAYLGGYRKHCLSGDRWHQFLACFAWRNGTPERTRIFVLGISRSHNRPQSHSHG